MKRFLVLVPVIRYAIALRFPRMGDRASIPVFRWRFFAERRIVTRSFGCTPAILILCAAFSTAYIHAQATIVGTVLDATGAVIPDADVVAVQATTGATRETHSGSTGRFQMPNVPIGAYTLRCEKSGFQTEEVQDVSLSIGQTLEQRITMRIAAASQTVEVNSQPEALATTATITTVSLGGERIDDSPIQQRNYLNFVLLAPGIATASRSSALRSIAALRSSDEDSGFTFGGLSPRNNGLYVDGLDNRDAMTGGNRLAVSPDMVQQFQVAGSDIAPASGGAAGANLNVVTQSGTNQWHGDASFFAGNQFTDARDPDVEATVRPRHRLYVPEASLGGPLRKNRTFLYTTVEQEWEATEDTSEVPDGSALKQLNATLAGPALANAATHNLNDSLSSTGSSSTLFFAKVEEQINQRNTVFAHYAYSHGVESNDVLATNNFADRSARGSSQVRDQVFAFGWNSTLSPVLVHQLRLQYARRSVDFSPNSRGALIEIPGVVSFGQSPELDGARSQNYVQAVESLTVARGSHLLGFGANTQYIHLDNESPDRFAGIYIFPTLASFTQIEPDVFIQRFGDPHTRYASVPVGAWFQDQWQPGHGVTVIGGLRYDAQKLPNPIPSAINNWSPRLGIAWHPDKSSWVFRSSFGLFHDTYPFAYLNNAMQMDGVHGFEQYAVGATAAQVFAATQGSSAGAPVAGVAHSIYRPDSHFPSTYASHLTAGVERGLGKNTTLTAEYLNVHGLHLPQIRNANGTLPPRYELGQTASSTYQGVTISVNHRLTNEVTYLVSYTESRAYDDASDFNQQPTNPNEPRLDWARSDQYQAHRFVASGIFELPFGDMLDAPIWLRRLSHEFEFGPVLNYGSPRPINALATTDLYRTGAYPTSARPAGVTRNPFFANQAFSFDMKVNKGFVMPKDRGVFSVGVSGFNLTNHTNPIRVSPYYSSGGGVLPTYLGLVEGLNARQFQFSVEWEF